MLLWEEYRQREPDGYRYSRWCELYRAWESRLSPTMRQAHPAGERVFVDYAGRTIDLTDGRTSEIRPTQIFVAVMGASNYTYAEATLTQTLPDWIGAHGRSLAFIGPLSAYSRLFGDLTLARGDGHYPRLMRALGGVKLLILDDWGSRAAWAGATPRHVGNR